MSRAEQIFDQALADLEGRMGVRRADLATGEILALARACERAASPFAGVNAEAAGRPVRVSEEVVFWPLTIGAVVWIEETADAWWADNPRKYRNALVHAAAHAREPGAFAPAGEAETERAIRRTLRAIAATSAEVDLALARILDGRSGPDRAETESTATDWAKVVAELEAGTGLAREHWLWGESYRSALRSYNALHAFAEAHGGERGARMLDELDRAVNALQSLKVAIMKRVKNG